MDFRCTVPCGKVHNVVGANGIGVQPFLLYPKDPWYDRGHWGNGNLLLCFWNHLVMTYLVTWRIIMWEIWLHCSYEGKNLVSNPTYTHHIISTVYDLTLNIYAMGIRGSVCQRNTSSFCHNWPVLLTLNSMAPWTHLAFWFFHQYDARTWIHLLPNSSVFVASRSLLAW